MNNTPIPNLLNQIDESLLLSSLISIAVVVVTVLLAISDTTTDKNYQKKFIIANYLIYYFEVVLLDLSFLPVLFTFLVIWTLSGINLIYSSESYSLESELKRFETILYFMCRWFFIVRGEFYILTNLLYFILSSDFIIDLFPGIYLGYRWWIYLIITVIIAGVHLTHNSMDSFDVKPFYLLRRKILLQSSKYFSEQTKHDVVQNMLGYILFIEDKDYYLRKKPTVSFKSIYRRKKNSYKQKLGRELTPKDYWNAFKKAKRRWTGKSAQSRRKYVKQYKRGYSTPAMQLTRNIVLKENSYKHKYRRKIFVEIIYLRFFWVAWRRYIMRVLGLKRENKADVDLFIKNSILLAYFYEILKGKLTPDAIVGELKSRINDEHYRHQWEVYKSCDPLSLKPAVIANLQKTGLLYEEWEVHIRVEFLKNKMKRNGVIAPHTL